MLHNLIETIVTWSLRQINVFGYGGLFLTMMLESMAIPIPSEVIVPFGGWLAASGRFSFWLVVVVTTLANLVGALILYFIGYYLGTAFLHRWGKYILVHPDDLRKLDSWLQRYGAPAAFIARLIPGTRTFSAVVFGAGETRLHTFVLYTFLGSFAWNLPWTYLGYKAGANWQKFQPYIRQIDYLIVAIILLLAIIYVFRHLGHEQKIASSE